MGTGTGKKIKGKTSVIIGKCELGYRIGKEKRKGEPVKAGG
jgi:hypothetical protein